MSFRRTRLDDIPSLEPSQVRFTKFWTHMSCDDGSEYVVPGTCALDEEPTSGVDREEGGGTVV